MHGKVPLKPCFTPEKYWEHVELAGLLMDQLELGNDLAALTAAIQYLFQIYDIVVEGVQTCEVDPLPKYAEDYAVYLVNLMEFKTPEDLAEIISTNWDQYEGTIDKILGFLKNDNPDKIQQMGKTFSKLWCDMFT